MEGGAGTRSTFSRGLAELASTGRAVFDIVRKRRDQSPPCASGRTMSQGALSGSAMGESSSEAHRGLAEPALNGRAVSNRSWDRAPRRMRRTSGPRSSEGALSGSAMGASCSEARARKRMTSPSAPAFWAAVTHLRPSTPASHHRRGRAEVGGRAATTPMARRRPVSSRNSRPHRASRGSPVRHCAGSAAKPVGRSGTMSNPARPVEAMSAVP